MVAHESQNILYAGKYLTGQLFDIDELGETIVLWIYDDDGCLHRLTDEFHPPIYAQGGEARLKQLSSKLHKEGVITGGRWVQRIEFWSGEEIRVIQFNVIDSQSLLKIRKLASSIESEVDFFNLDIPSTQYYLYMKNLFPHCRLNLEIDKYGNISEISAINSPWDVTHRLPLLRVMHIWGEHMQPLSKKSRLYVAYNKNEVVFHPIHGRKTIVSLNRLISDFNPDLILSKGGDSIIFPGLLQIAGQEKLPFHLDRDQVTTKRRIETDGRTYFSYGRVIYKPPSYPLYGRWHIDQKNSFTIDESGIEGLIELSRLSRVPIQRMSRIMWN